jgi:hypothetical protein
MGHSQAWLKSGVESSMTNNHCLHISHHNTPPTLHTSAQHHQLAHQNQKSTWENERIRIKDKKLQKLRIESNKWIEIQLCKNLQQINYSLPYE